MDNESSTVMFGGSTLESVAHRPALSGIVALTLLMLLLPISRAWGRLVTITFDDVSPGHYEELNVAGVQLRSMAGLGFDVVALNRVKTTPPNALFIPSGELVEITGVDPNTYRVVTGLGVTVASESFLARTDATIQVNAFIPDWKSQFWPIRTSVPPWFTLPPNSIKLPNLSTQHDLYATPADLSYKIVILSGTFPGIAPEGQTIRFPLGPFRAAMARDGTYPFDSRVPIAVLGATGGFGEGIYFDDLTLEVSVGPVIPYITQGNAEDTVDLVFVPGPFKLPDVERELNGFFSHLYQLIETDWETNNAFREYRDKFNVYFVEEPAKSISTSLFGGCPTEPPEPYDAWGFGTASRKGFASDVPFVDVVAVPQRIRDQLGLASSACLPNGGGQFYYPIGGEPASFFFHEAGHAIFGFDGEYCGDSIAGETPFPTVWGSEEECKQTALQEGWDGDECQPQVWDAGGVCHWVLNGYVMNQSSATNDYSPANMKNIRVFLGIE